MDVAQDRRQDRRLGDPSDGRVAEDVQVTVFVGLVSGGTRTKVQFSKNL